MIKYAKNNSVLNHLGIKCIKQNLLSEFEQVVQKTIHSWSLQESVDLESASVAIFGEFGAKKQYGRYAEMAKDFTHKFVDISRAAMTFPLNIPGTTYYKCLKKKESVLNTVRNIVDSRINEDSSPNWNAAAATPVLPSRSLTGRQRSSLLLHFERLVGPTIGRPFAADTPAVLTVAGDEPGFPHKLSSLLKSLYDVVSIRRRQSPRRFPDATSD